MPLVLAEGVNVVYWIRHPDHTDIFSQGYVGVTSRYEKRLQEHSHVTQNRYLRNAINKYGWESLVKEQIVLAAEDYCLEVERKLRPKDCIGWNLVVGGGKPPNALGKKLRRTKPSWAIGIPKSESSKKKIKEKVKLLWQNPEYREHMSKTHRGKPSKRKGIKHTPEAIEKMRKAHTGVKHSDEQKRKMSQIMTGRRMPTEVCIHCHKVFNIGIIRRFHMDNCKHKGVQKCLWS